MKNNPQAPLILTAALGAVWYGLVVFCLCNVMYGLVPDLAPVWMMMGLVFLPMVLLVAGIRLIRDLPPGMGRRFWLWLLLIMGPPVLALSLFIPVLAPVVIVAFFIMAWRVVRGPALKIPPGGLTPLMTKAEADEEWLRRHGHG